MSRVYFRNRQPFPLGSRLQGTEIVPRYKSRVCRQECAKPRNGENVRKRAKEEVGRAGRIKDASCDWPSKVPDVMNWVAAGVAKMRRTVVRHQQH